MSETTCSRPRIEGEREQQVLEAAVTALLEVGYDKLTFDLVAARAHASKATLYRKWPSKADLVLAAVAQSKECAVTTEPLPDTGALEDDLLALIARKDVTDSRVSDVISAVAPALTREEALRSQFLGHLTQPRADRYAEVLDRARRRGEIPEGVDVGLLKNVLPSFALHHTLVLGSPPPHDYLTKVIQQVLLPAAGLNTTT